jgi:hypothetical protein
MSPVAEYKQLIAEVPPRVIHSEKENRYYLGKINEMNARWGDLTKAERDLYETLAVLIEDFESLSEPGGVADRGDSGADGGERAQAERLGGSV